MLNQLKKFLSKPPLYAPSTNDFWDDAYISMGMLEAHLNPSKDAATRRHEFIDNSVSWISKIAPPSQYKLLLDLGCGPGLYADRFHDCGYSVTGIDFSKRSIRYAKDQSILSGRNIEYRYQNYLTIDYENQFDIITLIYCDYAALAVNDRLLLLEKIHKALKPKGKFIFDVFTPIMKKEECHMWQYNDKGGFWDKDPHICLESVYHYEDADHTELRQCVVITDKTINCYNIWDHFFTQEKLLKEINSIPFGATEFFGDIAGKTYGNDGNTICCVVTK